MNEVRPVIGGNDLDTFWQGRRDLCQLCFDSLDHSEGVFAGPHDHDAADHLALAVQLGNASTLVRPDLDMGNVPDQDRRAAAIRPDGNQFDILDRAQVAAPANHIFRAGHF
jgi:hypothetical protein